MIADCRLRASFIDWPTSGSHKEMNRASPSVLAISVTFAVILSPFVLIVLMEFFVTMPIHTFNVWRLERNFQTTAAHHPTNSRMLQKHTQVGGLYSDSSHSCNYFVGEFRSAPSSRSEIMRAYQGTAIASWDAMIHLPVKVTFMDDEGFFGQYPWYEWREELRGSSDGSAGTDTIYLLSAFQGGYSPDGDLRCY